VLAHARVRMRARGMLCAGRQGEPRRATAVSPPCPRRVTAVVWPPCNARPPGRADTRQDDRRQGHRVDHAADARGGQGKLGARHLRHVVGRAQPARVMPRRWHGGYTCRGPSATGEDFVVALRFAPVRPYPRPWRRSSCMLIDAAAEHATVAGSAARSRAFPTTPPPPRFPYHARALSPPRPPARCHSFPRSPLLRSGACR
jgi:hypothetical protein